MRAFSSIVKLFGIAAILFSLAVSVFAEQAPVYDADSASSSFDNEMDSNQSEVVDNSSPSTRLEHRIARIEQQMSNLQDSHASSRIDSLQNEVQSLREQVEQLAHQLQQLQSQQKAMYTDFDKRLAEQNMAISKQSKQKIALGHVSDAEPAVTTKLASKSISAPAKKEKAMEATTTMSQPTAFSQVSSDDQPNVAEEQQIYQTAYRLIKTKKYNEAVDVLQNMLHKYPSGQFAANAHYWLGELYGLMNKNDQALVEFNTVVKNYSNSPRVSDAQLKIAIIYAAQLKWSEAKTAFKKVINRYPGTAAARVASTQIKQIKQAGH
jgi:tol-pal system protein YbgF